MRTTDNGLKVLLDSGIPATRESSGVRIDRDTPVARVRNGVIPMRHHLRVLVAILFDICLGMSFATEVFAQESAARANLGDPVRRFTRRNNRGRSVKEHPHLAREGVRFTGGRNGQAVLIGSGPILIYQIHGNIPDQATLSFWIKPIDWQPNEEWRYVAVLCLGGRRGMIFANYPRREQATMQFQFSNRVGVGHEATSQALKPNAWNHVAIAWDGARSRVYFNSNLVLSTEHPAGWHPQIGSRATIHFGGISLESGSQRSFSRRPWGSADTALDDFVVYPGALSATQIAALTGVKKETRPFTGPPPQPHRLNIPKRHDAPTLDGQLSDAEWDQSLCLPTLIDARDPSRSFDCPQQRICFAYDDENLYAAMRCDFPMNAEIKQAPTARVARSAGCRHLDDRVVRTLAGQARGRAQLAFRRQPRRWVCGEVRERQELEWPSGQ